MGTYLMRLDVDVVLIITPKHNVVTQVFKDSIGIWVVVGYCWETDSTHVILNIGIDLFRRHSIRLVNKGTALNEEKEEMCNICEKEDKAQ